MKNLNIDVLNNVCEEVKSSIVPFCEKLVEIHADNIKAIILYGSATSKEFVPKKSNINIMIVFNDLGLNELKKSLKLVAKGRKKRITAPLFLTMRHIETSTDVFPIEFLEMKENHLLVYGEDILDDLKISQENIRLQCESQIKGKLIRLRQAYLEIGLKRKGIESLMIDSLTSLFPIFRNILRLKGEAPPATKEDVIELMKNKFNINDQIFLNILRDKKGDEKIGEQPAEQAFETYLEEIRKLALIVDELK